MYHDYSVTKLAKINGTTEHQVVIWILIGAYTLGGGKHDFGDGRKLQGNEWDEKKEKKANNLCLVPENMAELRSIIRCAECGGKLFRNLDDTWNCKAPSCRSFSHTVTGRPSLSTVATTVECICFTIKFR